MCSNIPSQQTIGLSGRGEATGTVSNMLQRASGEACLERPSGTDSNMDADNNDSESDSDMSMSDESDGDSDIENLPSTSAGQGKSLMRSISTSISSTAPISASNTSRKRPLSSPVENSGLQTDRDGVRDSGKRQRHSSPQTTSSERNAVNLRALPAELWQRVFTFCAPKVLGKLLQVDKCFNSYLVSSLKSPASSLHDSSFKSLNPEEIWRMSRNRFVNGAPKPLLDATELQMWKLACGRNCQFCFRPAHLPSNSFLDQWHLGPGTHGNLPIWQFCIRSCGQCLEKQTIKEIDLLLSSTISPPLISALPHIFFTNELHVVPSRMLHGNQHPSAIQITKRFLKTQVEDIKQEYENIKRLGGATADEWVKGLEGLGKERKSDAARWERWEAAGGLSRMQSNADNAIAMQSLSTLSTNVQFKDVPLKNKLHTTATSVQGGSPSPNINIMPTQGIHNTSNLLAPRFELPQQQVHNHFQVRPNQNRVEKTKEQVAELKALRKAEIERRSALLTPSLSPEVLAHMPSFQAAMQLTQPMTDSAWEILKPRLISQREDAERREGERQNQLRAIQARVDAIPRDQLEGATRLSASNQWEDAQAPLRTRIAGYAEELINDGWSGGKKVNHDNCPSFAADVLVYVRNRFYAEIAKDDAALRASGRELDQDTLDGPFTRKLTLEDMKWIFETKIKPITEPHRREIFLCNDCEFVHKYYGFEGIIQHYAAKHTSVLSQGNIVVHWKSEWPQRTPFHQNPGDVNPAHSMGAASSGIVAPGVHLGMPQNNGYPGFQPVHMVDRSQFSHVTYQVPVYQDSAPLSVFPVQGGPLVSPQFSNHLQQYHQSQLSNGTQPNTQEPFVNYAQHLYMAPHAVPAVPQLALDPATHTSSSYITQPPAQYVTEGRSLEQTQSHTRSAPLPTPQANMSLANENYKLQLQYLARVARDIWTVVSSLKEVPGSVKVYTVVYHTLAKFHSHFQEVLTLPMLADGLNNHKDMRPVRNVNGLQCRACILGLRGSVPITSRKHFSFPQLVNHFLSAHDESGSEGNGNVHSADWTKHLVQLPEASKLQAIPSIPGMDDQRLKMYGEALPEIFSPPTLVVNLQPGNEELDPQHYHSLLQPDSMDLAPSLDKHDTYYTSKDDPRIYQAKEDCAAQEEYDPRNPQVVDLVSPSYPATSPYKQYRAGRPNQTSYSGSHHAHLTNEQRHIASPVSPKCRSDNQHMIQPREVMKIEQPNHYKSSAYESVDRAPRSSKFVTGSRDKVTEDERAYYSNHNPAQAHSNYDFPRPVVPTSDVGNAPVPNNVLNILSEIQAQARLSQKQDLAPARNQPLDVYSEDGEVDESYPATAQREIKNSDETIQHDDDGNRRQSYHDHSSSRHMEEEYEDGVQQYPRNPKSHIKLDSGYSNNRNRRLEQPPHVDQRKLQSAAVPRDHLVARSYNEVRDEKSFSSASERREGPIYRSSADQYFPQSAALSAQFRNQKRAINNERPRTQHDVTPVPVDPRYKHNNVVYREEIRRTPNRFARYESVRLENERQVESLRSQSPVYIKPVGTRRSQLHERSPAPISHSVSPPLHRPNDERDRLHERPLSSHRQGYYQTYVDERDYQPNVVYERQIPQYEEVFELVRVSDPQGDYMIRRAIGTRRVMEPVYTTHYDGYEYAPRERQPVYVEERRPVYDDRRLVYEDRDGTEGRRALAGNGDYDGDMEEYDPRHPEPLANAPAQKIRYQ